MIAKQLSILALFSAQAFGSPIIDIDESLLMEPVSLGDHQARLIETGDGARKLVSREGVYELLRDGVGFVDVTEHTYVDAATAMDKAVTVNFPTNVSEPKLVASLQEKIHRPNLFNNLFSLTGFYTRFCLSESGVESTSWLFDLIKTTIKGRDDITASLYPHWWPQHSIIVRIEGSHTPEDVVILGAHLDSINKDDPEHGRAPGADDNGSGTITLVETLRIIAESGWRPRNTIELHWYSAEEIGLLGSLDIFAHYKATNVNVKAMMEQDMTGSIARYRGEVPSLVRIITNRTDPKLNKFIEMIVDEYTEIGYEEDLCPFPCSDFYSAWLFGFPAAFANERLPGTAEYPGFPSTGHSELDTIDRLDFTYMMEHVKLSLGYVVELGVASL